MNLKNLKLNNKSNSMGMRTVQAIHHWTSSEDSKPIADLKDTNDTTLFNISAFNARNHSSKREIERKCRLPILVNEEIVYMNAIQLMNQFEWKDIQAEDTEILNLARCLKFLVLFLIKTIIM